MTGPESPTLTDIELKKTKMNYSFDHDRNKEVPPGIGFELKDIASAINGNDFEIKELKKENKIMKMHLEENSKILKDMDAAFLVKDDDGNVKGVNVIQAHHNGPTSGQFIGVGVLIFVGLFAKEILANPTLITTSVLAGLAAAWKIFQSWLSGKK